MDVLTSPVLQWGSFGLLVVVLTGIGVFLRSYLNRLMDRQDKIDTSRQAEQMQQEQFIRNLLEQSRSSAQAQLSDWQALVQADIAAKEQLTVTLQSLTREIASHEDRAQQRHLALLTAFNSTEGVKK